MIIIPAHELDVYTYEGSYTDVIKRNIAALFDGQMAADWSACIYEDICGKSIPFRPYLSGVHSKSVDSPVYIKTHEFIF